MCDIKIHMRSEQSLLDAKNAGKREIILMLNQVAWDVLINDSYEAIFCSLNTYKFDEMKFPS